MKAHEKLAQYDNNIRSIHGPVICGIDEVARGCWAGPLVAGACILPENATISGLNDSKQLSHDTRVELIDKIKNLALAWSVFFIDAKDIDKKGLSWANRQAMEMAAKQCSSQIEKQVNIYLVDQTTSFTLKPYNMIVKGDATSLSIAAASVLAKVARDEYIMELAEKYPDYKFENHKGYINEEHKQAVKKYGMIKGVHRYSYNIKGFTNNNNKDEINLSDLIDAL